MKQTTIPFTKMQGAGNDFIMLDNRNLKLSEKYLAKLAPAICNRKFGIGSDGLISLIYDDTQKADLVMQYKNPDGSDAGMCGNGARCFAAFAVTLGSPKRFTFRVHNHVYSASVKKKGVKISFPLETTVDPLNLDSYTAFNVYTNTEHIVCPVAPEQLEEENVLVSEGRYLRNHEKFEPKGTNVNFIAGINGDNLCLQTYERGVENLTLACGTGAIASALAWHNLQQAGSGSFTYNVKVRGGNLAVHFSYDAESNQYRKIKLEGPAEFVFEGEYYL